MMARARSSPTEDQLLDAVIAGHTVCKQLCDLQLALVELAGKPKKEFIPPPADTSLEESVAAYMGSRLREATTDSNKTKRDEQRQQKDRLEMPPTQIARALKELEITWIGAHSPQAKGRVERSFATAQDRLVKGLRVARLGKLPQWLNLVDFAMSALPSASTIISNRTGLPAVLRLNCKSSA